MFWGNNVARRVVDGYPAHAITITKFPHSDGYQYQTVCECGDFTEINVAWNGAFLRANQHAHTASERDAATTNRDLARLNQHEG